MTRIESGSIERLSLTHRRIHTSIIIDAPAQLVWSVLTDTARYSTWARFLVDIRGEIVDGARITAVFQTNPAKEKLTTIDHRIAVVEGSQFHWAEKGPMGISDNHHFKVEPADESQTRFVQGDELIGGMTWLLGGYLSKVYLQGYQMFNRSLKDEAQRRRPSPSFL